MDCLAIKEEFTSSSIICRLCLVQNSNYYEVFGENHDRPEIADVLRSLLGISISPLDNWPKSICTGCVDKVFDFQTLQTRAKDNETRLVEVFGEYRVKEEIQPDRRSPVFISTEPKEGVKSEEEDDWDTATHNSFASETDVKEEDDLPLSVRRKPSSPKKSQLERKIASQTSRKPSRSRKVAKTDKISDVKPEKKPKDEKRDADIHTFFKMECVLCEGKLFPRFPDLQKHFRFVHKCRGYVVCCGKKLNSPMKMDLHMKQHRNPTKYQCSICLKYYKSTNTLTAHKILQHTPQDQREFACDKCPQRFAMSCALKRHMIAHIAPEDKKHVCSTCGQAFALRHILAHHIRRFHENACDSVCEICAKVYRSKYLFEKHMAEHNDQLKPVVPCTVCGKMFKYVQAMQKHRRRHNTSGSLECSICQHVASNRQALHEHIKYNHRERKTFQCNLCERVFKMRRSLKEHMASHTGQTLYKCPFCPKEFNSNGNYFHHRRTHHPVEYKADLERRRAEQIFQKD